MNKHFDGNSFEAWEPLEDLIVGRKEYLFCSVISYNSWYSKLTDFNGNIKFEDHFTVELLYFYGEYFFKKFILKSNINHNDVNLNIRDIVMITSSPKGEFKLDDMGILKKRFNLENVNSYDSSFEINNIEHVPVDLNGVIDFNIPRKVLRLNEEQEIEFKKFSLNFNKYLQEYNG